MNVTKIILFGSRARGDSREDSDYDIGLEFDTINEEEAKNYLKSLRPLLPMGIDVKILNTWKEKFDDVEKEAVELWKSNL